MLQASSEVSDYLERRLLHKLKENEITMEKLTIQMMSMTRGEETIGFEAAKSPEKKGVRSRTLNTS